MFNIFNTRVNRNVSRVLNKEDITMAELEKKQKMGITIIDVRSPQEYKEGHIAGSISIPEYEILKNINKYIKSKDQEIILYCQSGYRSKKAQKELQKIGYTNVFNLYNGFENY